jgi:hypothetical protein
VKPSIAGADEVDDVAAGGAAPAAQVSSAQASARGNRWVLRVMSFSRIKER